MTRSLLRLLLLLLVAVAVRSALGQDPPRSARDAYLEGWFLETAEGKLTDALRSYQRAVEVGGDADRELVAKALWRIGRIARARGDRTAARAQFERVVETYGDTDAAALARADLDDDGAKTAAIPDARREGIDLLIELLTKPPDEITSAKSNRMFLSAPVEDVAATYRRLGGPLAEAIRRATASELCEPMTDLYCLRLSESVSEAALVFLARNCRDRAIPDRVVEAAKQDPWRIASNVFELLVQRGSAEDVSRAISLVESSDDPVWFPVPATEVLFSRASAEDARLFGRLLDFSLATRPDAAVKLLRNTALDESTPLGEIVRRRFPELRPTDRLRLAQGLGDVENRATLDVLLADPEPQIRGQAIHRLMTSAADAERREGFERFLAEPPPYDISSFQSVVKRPTFPVTESTFDLVPAGSLRELLYSSLLNSEAHSIASVIEIGLHRGDPELVTAVLQPTFWRDPRFVLGNHVPSPGPRYQLTPPGGTFVSGTLGVSPRPLRDDLAASGDEALGRKFAEAAAKVGTESMRASFVAWIEQFRGDRSVAGALERFARDASAAIRRRVASNFRANDLAADVRRDMLLDEDATVATLALANLATPSVLTEAIGVAPDPRLRMLVERAIHEQWMDPIRAGYARLPATDDLAGDCLERLATADIDLALAALDREPAGNTVARRAVALVLPYAPDALKPILGEASSGSLSADDPAYATAVRALRDHADQVRERHRRSRIDEIVDAVRGPQGSVDAFARTLAELDAAATARELVRGADQRGVQTGALALVRLGLIDDLRDAFLASAIPEALVQILVDAGLTDEAIAAQGAGRVPPSTVLYFLLQAGRDDVLGDLLCPKDASVGRLERQGTWDDYMAAAIGAAVTAGDPDRLANAVTLYDEPDAVRALFQIGAIDRILVDLPRWRSDARATAFRELRRRTGIPNDPNAYWPAFRADQEALFAKWRTALGV